MGGIYGMIFGFMDVEDASGMNLQQKLSNEETYCFWIGLLLGGAGGLMNDLIGKNVSNIFWS
jgi:hypothetical protein